jgi:glycosyltransferase involved in cell wall biosynthesis
MKICIFADAQAAHIQRIVPDLSARGLEVHVVSHQPVPVPGATVERFCVPKPGLANPRPWPRRWAHYLRSFLERFDVVQVHYLHNWGFTRETIEHGCFMAFPWGSDIVPPPGVGPVDPELIEARRTMLRHAAAVAVCGPWFAARVAEFAGIDVGSVKLLPIGVDLSLFRPPRSVHSVTRRGRAVGFFKGFSPVYGATYLMRAIPQVLEVCPDAHFDLVGDGSELPQCQGLAREFGIEANIRWIERQPHRRIPACLADWDLSVIPSVCESFGVAALESSAMGVPVVASNVGGLTETVRHGETGLLVPPCDPERLAQAIITLLGNEPLRRRMAEAGRRMVEGEYNWQVLLGRWVQAYHDATQRVAAPVA